MCLSVGYEKYNLLASPGIFCFTKWLHERVLRKLLPDVIGCNAAITACARAGHWQAAMRVLQEMSLRCAVPDVVTYSAGIEACDTGRLFQVSVVYALSYSANKGTKLSVSREPLSTEVRSMKNPKGNMYTHIYIYIYGHDNICMHVLIIA